MSASREVSEAAPSTQEPVASGSAAGMDVDAPASASASAHAETSAEGATRNGAASERANATASQPAEGGEKVEGGEEEGDGSEGEGEEYEIEKILEHRPDVYVYGEMAYYVSWVGYGVDENSWVREADAENAEEMLADYWRKQKTTPRIRHISKTAERVWKEQQEAQGKSGVAAGKERGGPGKRDRDTGSLLPASKKQKQGRARARLADDDSDDDDEDVDLSSLSPAEREAILKKRVRRKYERLPDWENVVKQITNIERHEDGRLIAFFKFEDASLLAFDTAVIHHRCPQKLIAFYETRLRFRPANRGATEASGSAPAAESAAGNGTGTQANGDAQAQAATTNGDGGAQTGAAEGAVTAPEVSTRAEGTQTEATPAAGGQESRLEVGEEGK